MEKTRFLQLIIIIIFSLLAVSCGFAGDIKDPIPTEGKKPEAISAFRDYFEYLENGSYDLAVTYFGGSYEVLQDYNPTLDPDNYQELLRNACEINGFQCLRVNEIVDIQEISPKEFVISANFITGDGQILVRGPCCGASEEDMSPESIFTFKVIKNDSGEYKVLDLPVYLP